VVTEHELRLDEVMRDTPEVHIFRLQEGGARKKKKRRGGTIPGHGEVGAQWAPMHPLYPCTTTVPSLCHYCTHGGISGMSAACPRIWACTVGLSIMEELP
jgi:hypothetical protein